MYNKRQKSKIFEHFRKLRFQKKAQITMFIIVAIVLVIGAISFFIIRQQIADRAQEAEIETAIWANSIKNFVTDCIESITIKGLKEAGWHGGYIDPNDPTLTGTLMNINDNPVESDAVMLSEDLPIPYWFYLQTPNNCIECSMGSQMPGIQLIEQQLDIFVERQLPFCLNDFREFTKQGFDITAGDIEVNTLIATDDVSVEVIMPLDIVLDTDTTKINKFNSRIDIAFLDTYMLAVSTTSYETNEQKLEDIFLFFLSDYSQVPQPDKIPPIYWMDKKTSTVKWNLDQVKERIKNYVIGSHMNLIQVDKTRNAKRIQLSNPIEQGVYDAFDEVLQKFS